ncbi:hypothetical protein A7U43_28075 (plasmid) [Mycobacterium adipatum]|uniref:DUF2892 domain-containing protein n=1 Tax=Mycobacterium adipatum TaxID=1682113 RepID=A0A172UWG7_9MYCO|nr:hypothetical protein [Mycobacterium adipatum]ANE83383.1 hypothetical protein A7U43_28075 [Mycobacterium adipatum]MCB1286882.1 hypothetical protein [Mycobacterium sp.]
MTEHHPQDDTNGNAPRRDRAHGIARAVAAVGVGIAYAYVTGDIGQAITATGVALSLLREAFGRPPQ